MRPSLDPLPPTGPVPPEPRTAVLAPLGKCCSEPRGPAPVDAIVVHVTESPDRPGTTDLTKLARFLAGKGLAAHAADDAEGNSSRMVADDRLAYHATYWNVGTVGIEQVAYANLNRKQWLVDRRAQLDTTAAWIAYWAREYRIPIRRCVVAGLRYNRRKRVVAGAMVKRGVCSHAQLDPRNRDDPGPRYPWDYVLAKAREIASRA
jgi:N-acetyl-anhydromuramyl-L-alanine amidase AmpD